MTKYIPKHLQRPPTPVVSAALVRPIVAEPKSPPVPIEWEREVYTKGHIDAVRRAEAEGRQMRPVEAPLKDPIIVKPGTMIRLAPNGCPLIRSVVAATLSASGMTHALLVGGAQSKSVVRWRQAAMVVARDLVGASTPEIGRHFNRDHSTVLHAISASEKRPKVFGEYMKKIKDQLV